MTNAEAAPSPSPNSDQQAPASDVHLEMLGRELMNVVKLASEVTAQWPGYLLFGVGLVLVLAPVASKLVRVFGIGFGEFDSIEFVAAVTAGAIVLIAGTLLHTSDNGVRKDAASHAVKGAVEVRKEEIQFGVTKTPG